MSSRHRLEPSPDLYPLYPSPQSVVDLLDGSCSLTSDERASLVAHALHKSVSFGDIALLTFLLRNSLTRSLIDLSVTDEDGLGLVSQAILLFGEESDRDVDREEVIRLLISEGADVASGDASGWTPLHFAALHAPPTLISFLLTHGASPLAKSHRGLTPLDVITAYEEMPGRADISMLLEAHMRGQGWFGNERERRRERNRRLRDMRVQKVQRQRAEWGHIGRILELPQWWGEDEQVDNDLAADSGGEEDGDGDDAQFPYTPPSDCDSMLVFSLNNVNELLDSLVTQARPVLRPLTRRAAPANGLYYLGRFACTQCDLDWVEELLLGAVDKIEENIHTRPEDLGYLAFWLFNSTLLLHLLQCDSQINQAIDINHVFDALEELINAILVFVIRIVEKRIDPLIDATLLEHSPLAAEFETIQFESEWSFFRSFATPKRKPSPASPPTSAARSPISPPVFQPPPNVLTKSKNSRPSSPIPVPLPDKSAAKPFNALRFRSGASSPVPSSPSREPTTPQMNASPGPILITDVLTAVHTLLSLFGINPTMIVQAMSQVFYWTSCELFNRLISRKKYLCRSRAMQIGMNVGVLEEWVVRIGLPKGVSNHFACVRQLLSWLQCQSSILDFPTLVDTIQTMKSLNPLQMRRAVKDHRYEVNEGRMTDECSQYLAQLQKDWERQRIKLGVELARKERQRDRDEDFPSTGSDDMLNGDDPSRSSIRERDDAQRMVDNLFDPEHPKSEWLPPKPPEPLGELMNSRYMLPVVLPSDPALLCASSETEAMHPPQLYTAGMDATTLFPSTPTPSSSTPSGQANGFQTLRKENGHNRNSSRASYTSAASATSSMGSVTRGPMRWRNQARKVREVDLELLDLVGGVTHTVWERFGVRFLKRDSDAADGVHAGEEELLGVWETEAVDEESTHRRSEDIEQSRGVLAEEILGSPIHEREEQLTPIVSKRFDFHHHRERSSDNGAASFISSTTTTAADTASIASSKASLRSHLTPNLPRPNADRRRSIRMARRSSGGETAMPAYEYNFGGGGTPTVERPLAGLA